MNGDVTVNFPEQNRWTGLLVEMERMEVSDSDVLAVANTPSPLLGPFDSPTVAATLQGILLIIIHYSISILSIQPSLVVSVTASHQSGPGSNPTAVNIIFKNFKLYYLKKKKNASTLDRLKVKKKKFQLSIYHLFDVLSKLSAFFSNYYYLGTTTTT